MTSQSTSALDISPQFVASTMSSIKKNKSAKRRRSTHTGGTPPGNSSSGRSKKTCQTSPSTEADHTASDSEQQGKTGAAQGLDALATAIAAAEQADAKKQSIKQKKAVFLAKFSGKTPEEVLGKPETSCLCAFYS